jgi:hypothetical protein
MRKLLANLPSPAMAVAFIALLAALSGTATALQGKNTVDSGDIKNGVVKSEDIKNGAVTSKKIKNGAVTSKKIKNGAVTSAKVKDGSLTGTDINESTLGQVPSANTANTANTASSANTANTANSANRANSAGAVDGRTPFLVKLSAGQTQTIATHGAVSIQASCIQGVGFDEVDILAATSQNGAAMGGNDSYSGASGDTLDTTTPANQRVILSNSAGDGNTNVSWNIDEGWVMAPNGQTLGIDGETTPLGLNYAGAECVASGVVNASG